MLSGLLPEDPRSVGSYRLVGRLGAGATGVVYEAVSTNGEHVALKVLHASVANAPGIRERLRREGRALRRVSGARAVRVIEIDADGPLPFLAMDLVEGQTLDVYVNTHGPIRGALLWGLAEGLVEALSDVHAAAIVHRDLKPSNVILGPDGVRVVDFGISVLADATSLTSTGSFVGTAAWLSPEQVQGEEVTAASDIFSFGLLLAYASAGYHPFGLGRSDAIMYRIVHGEPNLDDVSESLRSIVEGCIKKSPQQRFSLGEVRDRVARADKRSSVDSPMPSDMTRVVDIDEQIEALVDPDEQEQADLVDREVLYDVGDWSEEVRDRLIESLESASIEFEVEGDEIAVSKTDELAVDGLVRSASGLPPLLEYPKSAKVSGRWRSGLLRLVGLVAGIGIVVGGVVATRQTSESNFVLPPRTTLKTTSTISQRESTYQKLKSQLSLLNGRVVDQLEAMNVGEEFSSIVQNPQNALLMSDIIQTDCRGRWLVNEILSNTGMTAVLYDEYFSNFFDEKTRPRNFIISRVGVTVLRDLTPDPSAFFRATVSVLGGNSKTCIDSDFSFALDDDLNSCVKFPQRGAYSLITADVDCVTAALRSVPWETDSSTKKSYEVELDSDVWGPSGDTLLVVGSGASRTGTEDTSLDLLVWVDPTGEYALIVTARATSLNSVHTDKELDKRVNDTFLDVLDTVFSVAKPIVNAGSD